MAREGYLILDSEHGQWLGKQPAEPAYVKALLVPYPSEGMVAWPVSARVGSMKNNDTSLTTGRGRRLAFGLGGNRIRAAASRPSDTTMACTMRIG